MPSTVETTRPPDGVPRPGDGAASPTGRRRPAVATGSAGRTWKAPAGGRGRRRDGWPAVRSPLGLRVTGPRWHGGDGAGSAGGGGRPVRYSGVFENFWGAGDGARPLRPPPG